MSSVVVCNAAGGRAGRPPGAWTVGAQVTGRVGGRHCTGGPVRLRPVRVTPCYVNVDFAIELGHNF